MCLTDVDNFSQGGGDHSHNPDWVKQYDASPPGGVCGDGFNPPCLDGACYSSDTPSCPDNASGYPEYPPYTYVDPNEDKPYFSIAEHYGFANYMFSTHEGPVVHPAKTGQVNWV
jgi:hypothetical protein